MLMSGKIYIGILMGSCRDLELKEFLLNFSVHVHVHENDLGINSH